MQNDIWAIFKHMIQDDSISMAEQHANCPKYGWCKYWENNPNYDPSKKLPCVFVEVLKPIFTELTNEDILKRCLKGFTWCSMEQYVQYVSRHVSVANNVYKLLCVKQFVSLLLEVVQ